MRKLTTLAVLVLLAASAHAEFTIQDIEASYGIAGPVRSSLEYYPFEQVFFRYVVKGITVDDQGRSNSTMMLRLTGPGGKVLDESTKSFREAIMFGGNTLPGTAHATLPNNPKEFPLGKYEISVTLKDNLNGNTASFSRQFTLKPVELAILSPEFSYVAEGKAPAPCGGLVGQTLHFRFRVIGFDRTKEKIHTQMFVQVLDARGKPQMPVPLTAQVESNKPEQVKQVPFLTFSGHFGLTRPGDFVLRILIIDRTNGNKTLFMSPLHVREP